MTTNLGPASNDGRAGVGLAMVRLTIGAMFVWVFFENLGRAFTPREGTQA